MIAELRVSQQERCPVLHQSKLFDELIKRGSIHWSLGQESGDAVVVFGPMHIQRNGREVFRGKNPGGYDTGRTLIRYSGGGLQCGPSQTLRIIGREELNRNTFDEEKLSFKRVPASFQVREDFSGGP